MRGVPPPNGGIYRGVPPPNDGIYRGVPPPNDGGAIRYRWNRLRPAFMEPLAGGGGGGSVGCGGKLVVGRGAGDGLRMRKRSSSFPLKEDAGYIGYLTDDDESVGGSGDQGEGEGAVMKIVDRRRRELIGSDISFSSCMLMMITVCGLLMLFLFAASPWGIPPPRRL